MKLLSFAFTRPTGARMVYKDYGADTFEGAIAETFQLTSNQLRELGIPYQTINTTGLKAMQELVAIVNKARLQ